jgi:hypothetical protein
MRALHLPALDEGQPNLPSGPSDLIYSTSYPGPNPPPSLKTHVYLISVTATALTRGELTWVEIDPTHRNAIPGHDVVGSIHTVFPSPSVSTQPIFKPGDKVWGLIDFDRNGAAATYTIAYESELSLVPSPPSGTTHNDWENALATLPLSALTAYQSLFVHGPFSPSLLSDPSQSPQQQNPNGSILLLGPTGSVGLPTLSLAWASNINVCTYNSPRHIPFLQDLESQFTSQPKLLSILSPTESPTSADSTPASEITSLFLSQTPPTSPVDLVISPLPLTSSLSLSLLLSPDIHRVLKPNSKILLLSAPLATLPLETQQSIEKNLASTGLKTEFFIVTPDSAQLEILGQLATRGELKGFVKGLFDLERGGEGMGVTEGKSQGEGDLAKGKGGEGRRYGKVVLRVGE